MIIRNLNPTSPTVPASSPASITTPLGSGSQALNTRNFTAATAEGPALLPPCANAHSLLRKDYAEWNDQPPDSTAACVCSVTF
jgi:hypothetical protein